MRINETAMTQLVKTAATLSVQQTQIAQQLSSGVRVSALSDDPAAAGQSGTLSNTIAQADCFTSSAATARSRGQAADSALGAAVTQLTSAISIAVQGQTDTANASDRAAYANQLSSLRDTLLNLANSSYSGSYLFAGTATASAPFSIDSSGTVTYAGNSQTSTLTDGNSGCISIATSANGSNIFLNASASIFSELQSAITALQSGNAPGASTVTGLRDSLSVVTAQRAGIDTNLNRVDAALTYTATQETYLKADQSKLIAADHVALASELSAAQTQRNALLSTISIVQKGSLFDYL